MVSRLHGVVRLGGVGQRSSPRPFLTCARAGPEGALEREQEAAAQIVGRWLNEGPLRYRMTIFHEGGELYTEQKFTDGGSLKKEMVEKRSPLGRRFDPVEASRAGDHWIIDSRGNLQSRDNDGLITTARKIE